MADIETSAATLLDELAPLARRSGVRLAATLLTVADTFHRGARWSAHRTQLGLLAVTVAR